MSRNLDTHMGSSLLSAWAALHSQQCILQRHNELPDALGMVAFMWGLLHTDEFSIHCHHMNE